VTATVAELAAALGLEADGDLTVVVGRPAAPEQAGPGDLAVAMERRYARALEGCRAEAAILWPGADFRALGFRAALFAPRPRLALAGLTARFDSPDLPEPGIHPMTDIHPQAEIGPDAAIGPFVQIGRGARIGPRARIAAGCSIGAGAVIGADALLHPGVRIGARVRIGDRFIAQPNAVIGADGFSFVTPERGAVEEARAGRTVTARSDVHLRIASIGAVSIGDDVEIGAGSCIDRGTIADTEIGAGTKIDNLVQIGHNVRIGRSCLICGQAGVAGSSRLGDRVVLGGKVGVADHVTIGDDVLVAAGSGVASNIPGPGVVMGAPAIARDRAAELIVLMRRLPELFRRVEALQKQVSNSGSSG